MRFSLTCCFLLLPGCLFGCGPASTEHASPLAAGNPTAPLASAPYFQDTLFYYTVFHPDIPVGRVYRLLDTTGVLPLLAEKTMWRFRKTQLLPFTLRTDTVINDERGIFTGKELRLGNSTIEWLDSNHVSRARISDQRIQLNHGVQVGMTRQQVQQRLGLEALPSDTLVVETGYLLNHCTFYFWQGHLRTVCLTNLPD